MNTFQLLRRYVDREFVELKFIKLKLRIRGVSCGVAALVVCGGRSEEYRGGISVVVLTDASCCSCSCLWLYFSLVKLSR